MKASGKKHLFDFPEGACVFGGLKDFNAQYSGFIRSVVSVVKGFNDFADQLPDITAFSVRIMGEQGWFMGVDTPLVGQMAVTVNLVNIKSEKIDGILSEYFRNRIPLIHKKLNNNFPARAHVWDAAFRAHAKGEYLLCIPVFLAQADGIWQEALNRQLYSKKHNKLVCSKKGLSDVLLSPLNPALPINMDFDHKKAESPYLNRNEVLHGKAVNYGTEINSLKAISFLDFVADCISYIRETRSRSIM